MRRIQCRIDSPVATPLADLAGIRDDLQAVLSYCDLLDGQVLNNYIYPVTWDALSVAAVVTYCRCFSSGLRRPLERSLLESADQALRQAHEYFVELRNKHVAHSVNAFEENVVLATVEFEGEQPQHVSDVSVHSLRFVGVHHQILSLLRSLAEYLLSAVELQYETKRKEVTSIAQKELLSSFRLGERESIPAAILNNSPKRPRSKR